MTYTYIPKNRFEDPLPDILTYSSESLKALFIGKEVNDVVNTLEQFDFEMVTSDRFPALWQNTSIDSLLCFEFENKKVKSYGSLLYMFKEKKKADFIAKTPKNLERAAFVRFKNAATQNSIR